MRIGLVVTGIVFLVIGILMVLFFWPMVGYETKETFRMKEVKAGDVIRYVGEITDITEFGDINVLELDNGVLEVYTEEEDFHENEKVLVTIEFGENTTNWGENTYRVQKIPTLEGSFGAVIFLFGLVVMAAGIAARKRMVEELVQISVQPAVQSPMPKTSQVSAGLPTPPSEALTTSSSVSAQYLHPTQIEQVTCPKCGKVFGVKGLPRPAKISCPECGLGGILE